MKFFSQKRNLILLCCAAGLLAASAIWLLPLMQRPGDTANFSLEDVEILPLSEDSYGVEPVSDFLLKIGSGLPLEQLKQMIKTVPAVDFTLTAQTAGNYLLKLSQALKPHSIFSVVLAAEDAERSWAFQTKKAFGISSTLPIDGATYVPLNRGIEIIFSHSDVPELTPFFEIKPHVEGSFEHHGSSWVFLPQELAENTQYEVTVASELSSDNGNTLGEPYRFAFTTEQGQSRNKISPLALAGDYAETFTSDDLPLIELYPYYDQKWQDASFEVTIHTLASEQDYLTVLQRYHEYLQGAGDSLYAYNWNSGWGGFHVDPDSLNSSAKAWFTGSLIKQDMDSYYQPTYIVLPETLAPGWYLVDISAPEDPEQGLPSTALQKLIQVHDSAVYLHSTYETLTVWLNDTRSGKPLSEQAISLNGALVGSSDVQGVAVVATPKDQTAKDFAYLTIDAADSIPFITAVTLYGANEQPRPEELYATYLYTDRSAYLPNDTVQIWGVVRSRGAENLPGMMTLTLSTWRYSYRHGGSSSFESLLEIPVQLTAGGTFSASLPLQNLASGYYTLNLVSSEHTEVICSTSISVMEYVKPIYTGDITPAKPAYFVWETVEMEAEVGFFDGTPAAGLPLSLSFGDYPAQQEFTKKSDSQGRSRFSFLALPDNSRGWRPYGMWYTVRNAAAEDAPFNLQSSIPILMTDVMLRASWDADAQSLTVNSNRIDLSEITESNEVYYDDYRNIQGETIDLPFRLEIHQVVWHKVETGSIYDFINKEVVKQYRYDREDKVVKTLSEATVGGVDNITGLDFARDEYTHYYGVVLYRDTRGAEFQETVYLGPENHRYYVDPIKNYRFRPETYLLAANQSTLVNLEENYSPLHQAPGRILALTLHSPEGYLDHRVTEGIQFSFSFTAENIPSIHLQGAYFDGKRIYPVYATEINYAPEERRLNIELQSDKSNYQPGDTVNLSIAVIDQEGKAVPADLYLSVVDEAAFAVSPHEAEPLTALYRRISPPNSWNYASYVQHVLSPSMMAEKGGGEGVAALRKNFLDNAFTLTTTSDASGKAEISFTLPDNLTSWRITTLAVSEALQAGNSKLNITMRIPFFLDMLLGRTYIAGDDIALSLRTFGTSLQGDEEVAYRVLLSVDGQPDREITMQGKAGEYANFNFGALPPGDYTVQAYADCGDFSDALQKEFRVVNSAVELPLSEIIDPQQLGDIEPKRNPITLIFYDKVRELQMRAAFRLLAAPGTRVDQRLGASQAAAWLAQYQRLSILEAAAEESFANIQTYRGGVRLLPDAAEDPVLTAKICVAAPHILNTTNAADYLYTVIDNPDSAAEHVAAAYMGLAALREPVLLDVRNLLQHPEGLQIKDRLYLLAALSLLGDTTGAKEQYQALVTPMLRNLAPWSYLDSGAGGDLDLELTALASLSALSLDPDNAAGMIAYLIDHPSQEILTNLEITAFLQRYLPKKATPASFSYQRGGETVQVSLEEQRIFELECTAEQLQALNLQVTDGELGLTASYIGAAEELFDESANKAQVTKLVEPVEDSVLLQSGLVKITLYVAYDQDAPQGCYMLTDMIPSGMRFVSVANQWNHSGGIDWYLQRQEGQRIVFYNYKNISGAANGTIVYYARNVLPGTFLSESAYLQSLSSAAWGKSSREMIEIAARPAE